MKKVFTLIAILVACSFTSVMAQNGGGFGGGQMDPAQRAAMYKERIKDLNLTAVQQDSVVAVWSDRSLMQSVFAGANFREMSPEDRQAKTKELNDARSKRLVAAGLTEDQAKAVIEKLSVRPGGGRPAGNQ